MRKLRQVQALHSPVSCSAAQMLVVPSAAQKGEPGGAHSASESWRQGAKDVCLQASRAGVLGCPGNVVVLLLVIPVSYHRCSVIIHYKITHIVLALHGFQNMSAHTTNFSSPKSFHIGKAEIIITTSQRTGFRGVSRIPSRSYS